MTAAARARSRRDQEPAWPDRETVDCSVIVVTYNSERHVVPFVESLRAAAGDCTLRVVVVDNESADGTVEAVRALPGITCVESGGNLGYSGGINVGREHAGPCGALLVANPDVRLEPGAIERLHEAVTTGGHGAAVPMLRDGAGEASRSLRREPSVLNQLGEALLGDRLPGRPAWLSEIVRDTTVYGHPHEISWAAGAVLMVSAQCNEQVGEWDESYFLFSEEVDYSERIRAKGFTIAYVPAAVATHEEGGSGRPLRLMGLVAVNRLRYFRQRHGPAASAAYAGGVLLQLLVRALDSDHRRAIATLARVAPAGVLWNRFPEARTLVGGPRRGRAA